MFEWVSKADVKKKQQWIYIVDIVLFVLILYGLLATVLKLSHLGNEKGVSKPGSSVSDATVMKEPVAAVQNGEVSLPASVPASLPGLLLGIDVSHYQGDVKWKQVATGFHFGFVKATEGDEYVDPRMSTNLERIAATTMNYGVYHFFLPDIDAQDQARHFVESTREYDLSLPPVLDVEVAPQGNVRGFIQSIRQWIDFVRKSTGCSPILYTSKSFWNRYLKKDFQNSPIWISDYTTDTQKVSGIPWEFWQFTEEGRASGVSGPVDQSRYQGSLDSLKSLGECMI